MGYWITHNIRIVGTTQDVAKVIDKLTSPHPTGINDEGDIIWSDVGIESVSLYNFSPPPEDMLITEKWWGDEGHAWRMENWSCNYDWQATTFTTADSGQTLYVSFETKYDWPINPFRTFIESNPSVNVYIWSEGEENEATEIRGIQGQFSYVEYAPPESHADWVERDGGDGCRCSWAEDMDDWFSDCPRPGKVLYKVIVAVAHYVEAYDEKQAIEIVQNFENGFDIPDGRMVTYAANTGYTASVKTTN